MFMHIMIMNNKLMLYDHVMCEDDFCSYNEPKRKNN